MAAYPTYRMQVACPSCGQANNVTVEQVMDVGQSPTQKERLLRGRVNTLRCSRCGVAGPLAMPMVYHDPAHDLLLAYVPHEMGLSMEQEEREIGKLTNLVLEGTPAAQRRAYLLNPTRVMTYDGLLEKVLETEGVSPEDLKRQSLRIHALTQLARVADDAAGLSKLIEEHREVLDEGALMLLAATIQQAEATGDAATAQRYGMVREGIVTQLGLTPEQLPDFSAGAQMDAVIEQLLTADPSQLAGFVAANRPLLDYSFFMHLTQRADVGDPTTKGRLLALRDALVQAAEEVDRSTTAAMTHAAGQLRALLQAPDLEAKLEEIYPELDEAFLVVLSANMEQAQGAGRDDVVRVLTHVYRRVVERMEDRLQPELRAINQLLRLEEPAAREALLRETLAAHDATDFVEMIEALATELEEAGRAEPEVIDRLYALADDARALAAGDAPAVAELTLPGDKPAGSGLILTPDEERRRRSSDGPGIVLA